MLTIRLTRIGKSAQPSFKLILQEKTSSPKGKALEIIGSYNPKSKEISFKKDRIEYWISKGAQPSSTVAVLLKRNGMTGMEKYTKIELHQRKKKKGEEAAAPAAPVAPAPAAAPAPAKAAEPAPVAAVEAPAAPVEAAAPAPAPEKPAETPAA
ncbi:MAG: 30S ribosomal protein S16, small subunit ribosomal protein S16 [Candidatus Peregrinibacteria bacterium GW2011_GWC2_39_14]|nr:MAG: 30S ribosomal protein S16 [Candidatus Peregrinibacteria bacterium GW2011_GWA2_38_36]KKR07163.1 MAG: 30S ribosomal protein S16, small subunit ribosomal protein S16 [Candidatus Peregrinibacteria bacterium GW2011_GWC2_39_14]